MTGFYRIACAWYAAGALFAVPVYANDPHTLEEVLVSAPLASSTADTALPVSVLSGQALQRQATSTLGETLSRMPGITSASFGNGVGQPVIRGQGGGRVSVLSNSIANADASAISPDHANGTEPLLADRIEVIRGPATLLYGSGAIGGVVNVIDNRIPQAVPERTRLGFEQRHDTGNNGNTSVVRADGGAGSLAWHWDGVYRENKDLEIPGLAERYPDEPARSGVLENSDARAWSSTGGVSYVFDTGYTGVAWSHLENDYGLPGHAHEGEAPVRIGLEQDRFDWKSEWSPGNGLTRSVRTHLAYTDYQHSEYAGAETGTVFDNETTEARVEWLHQPIGGWNGVIGLQLLDRNFSARGEEAFVPKSDIRGAGLFWIEQFQRDAWTWEFGLRFDDQHIDAEGYRERSHQAFSGSASAIIELAPQHSLTAALSRSERAPTVEELFSDGVHEATATYDQANPNLDTEVSMNVEFGYRYTGNWHASANLFYNRADDYIAAINTGRVFNEDTEAFENTCSAADEDECLPVYRYTQEDAVFYGYELEAGFPLPAPAGDRLELLVFTDYVRGEFDKTGDTPRLPPLRYGAALQWDWASVNSELRWTRAQAQDRAGINETETGGYTLIDASVDWVFWKHDQQQATWFIRGLNLLDDDVRNSASYLRDIAPEAGRRFETGVRLRF